MNSRCAYQRLGLLALVLLTISLAQPARAQIPDAEDALVYGINATAPGEVFGTFSPPQVDEIYVLAGRVSILSPRQTKVFYWPITQKYRVAWSLLNEEVDGVLEIMQDGRHVETIASEPYTAHFEAAGSTTGQLYVGKAALAAEARLSEQRQAYQRALEEYWQGAKESPAQADPPVAVDQYTVGLHQGFPVSLTSGEYQVYLRRPNGEIVVGSERTLQVFAPRRSAVGYEIIPEERWTRPEQLNARDDVLLAKPGSVIYLKARLAHEYPSLAYEHMKDPQYDGQAGKNAWRWVQDGSGEAKDGTVLEVMRAGAVIERIAREPFFVRQAYEHELGYEVVPFDPGKAEITPRVDFEGYRLQLPLANDSFVLRLRSADGTPDATSAREVRVMTNSMPPLLVYSALSAFALVALFLSLHRLFARPPLS